MKDQHEKNPAAVALGRRGADKPKHLSEEQRNALAERMRLVSLNHHAKQRARKVKKVSAPVAPPAQDPPRDWEDTAKQFEAV